MKNAGMIAAAFLCIFMLTAAGCGKGKSSCFTGTKTVSADGISMNYSILDREETFDINLSAGEKLHVEFSHSKGNVDVTVGISGKEYLFRGSEQTNGGFDLVADETGTYHISVTGHRAAGSIGFTRASKGEGTK